MEKRTVRIGSLLEHLKTRLAIAMLILLLDVSMVHRTLPIPGYILTEKRIVRMHSLLEHWMVRLLVKRVLVNELSLYYKHYFVLAGSEFEEKSIIIL